MAAGQGGTDGFALLAKARNDDAEALELFSKLYFPTVECSLRRRFGELLRDDDRVSLFDDLLLALLLGSATEGRVERLLAYMCTMAFNMAVDLLAKRDREIPPIEDDFDAERMAREDRELLRVDDRETFNSLLSTLGVQDRQIVFAWASGGKKWADDLAKVLGIPANTLVVRRIRLCNEIRKSVSKTGGRTC